MRTTTKETAMSIVTRPLTYEDLLQMPADGNRYEVIDGELFVTAAPMKKHQKLSKRLAELLYEQEKAGMGEMYYAPVDVRLFTNGIVQPDLLFIRRDRLDIYRPSGLVEGAPDLVVEILSPSTRNTDLVHKAAMYAREGVPEYWIADPDAPALTVYALRDGRYAPVPAEPGTARSLVLPDLVVDLAPLFADLQ
jgi:Uma2 family endonuclease